LDEASFLQIRSFWPDVADPFSRIVPDGCFLVRTEDDWTQALRTRTVDFARTDRCPALADLLDEAREDAERRGWTPIDDPTDDGACALELEGVHCRIEPVKLSLRVAFHQPWPADAGAPVETSEMFQNLVRKLLKLGGEPARLTKEVALSGEESAAFSIDVLTERASMPQGDARLIERLRSLAFIDAEDGSWVSAATASQQFDVVARVRFPHGQSGNVEVEMLKVRSRASHSGA
jgi:hypothetical protein